jgi:replication initiation and membrane attachment protein DnaB
MKMTTENLKKFREEFANTVKNLEKEFGVSIKIGNISFDSDSFKSKLEVKNIITESGISVEQKNFEQFCELYRLKKDSFGKEFTNGSTNYKIVGLDLNKRKYPICLINTQNQKRLNCTAGLIPKNLKKGD